MIGAFLQGEDLCQYRQLSRAHYNVVEKKSTLRIQHRLFVVSKDIILQPVIGNPEYKDRNYVLTSTIAPLSYQLTQITVPFTTLRWIHKHASSQDRLIDSCIDADRGNEIRIFTLTQDDTDYDTLLTPNNFKEYTIHLYSYNVNSLSDGYVLTNKKIRLEIEYEDPPSDKALYQTSATLHLDQNNIAVNFKCEPVYGEEAKEEIFNALTPTRELRKLEINKLKKLSTDAGFFDLDIEKLFLESQTEEPPAKLGPEELPELEGEYLIPVLEYLIEEPYSYFKTGFFKHYQAKIDLSEFKKEEDKPILAKRQ